MLIFTLPVFFSIFALRANVFISVGDPWNPLLSSPMAAGQRPKCNTFQMCTSHKIERKKKLNLCTHFADPNFEQ